MRQHKTLETLLERAERNGEARNGKWRVEVIHLEDCKKYMVWHWGTLVLEITNYQITYIYGESKSDADGISAVCSMLGLNERFTYRPVNGGFMQVA